MRRSNGKAIRFVAILAASIALAMASAPEGRAQSGVCCVNTTDITLPCQSQGCSGSVTIHQCTGGYGIGAWYETSTVGCCTAHPSTLINPSGSCHIYRPETAGNHAESPSALVWVRNCDGVYTLVKVAVAA